LPFSRGQEHNAKVHSALQSKVRVSDDRDEEEHGFTRGNAQPDFICIGAQKAGTSWLFHQLTSHPDFWMPPIKELRYFDSLSKVTRLNAARCKDERDRLFMEKLGELSSRPYLDLESYSILFEAKGALLSGDITPGYSTLNDEVIERVMLHFPNLKVIFLARDPVERAWSQLSMEARLGNLPAFDPADTNQVIRKLLYPGVILRSHLSKIVTRWKRYVRSDAFRVYFFDDLQADPAELRRSIIDFLGADPDKPSGRLRPDHNSHAGFEKLRLTAKMRLCIAQFFEQELKTCASELGGAAKHWPGRYGFSLVWFLADLVDDVDLFAWCDWLA